MDGSAVPGPHPNPPPSGAERLHRLRLLRSRRVGPATYARLMAEHGSAAAALEALPEIAARAGIDGYAPCPLPAVEAEMREGRRLGARVIFPDDPEWPDGLSAIADAPPLLWARGDRRLLARPAVALVGAREASSLGLRMARSLGLGVAKAGFVVVSGLARGVDREAHEAALERGTIAVLAGGVGARHAALDADLMDRVAANGLLLSEHPPGRMPAARDFARRNRIVSGLSRAVVVVEAAARSGSMITARAALDQGREVLAVPGHPFDPRSAGCNMLLRDGARLVRGPSDVAEAVGRADHADLPLWSGQTAGPDTAAGPDVPTDGGPPAPARPAAPPHPAAAPARARTAARVPEEAVAQVGPPRGAPAPTDPPAAPRERTDPVAAAILGRLAEAPADEDELIGAAGVGPARLAPALLALELDGRIERRPGGRIHAL
ncbi:MAG: DNA-processing protein DprA [Hasllibacter sp.]